MEVMLTYHFFYAYISLRNFLFFKSFLNIFLKFIHEQYRERKREAETQAEGEARSMQEPDVGLDPRSLPEPKAAALSLSHPGIPR